jgi:hypothetical protein
MIACLDNPRDLDLFQVFRIGYEKVLKRISNGSLFPNPTTILEELPQKKLAPTAPQSHPH